MAKQKSIFDTDVDVLRRKLARLARRERDGMPVSETVVVDRQLLEMLIEDHDDLKSHPDHKEL